AVSYSMLAAICIMVSVPLRDCARHSDDSPVWTRTQDAGHGKPIVRAFCEHNRNYEMPGNPREMITMAERRFPARVRIGVPPGGFGQRYSEMTAWLDGNCGSDGWAITPSGMRGVLNDAVSIYFLEATLASAFVARWCAGSKAEAEGGVFRLRDDELGARIR